METTTEPYQREEKQKARIVIFGHSWGASETVTLARKLERDGIPVLLTIQVDSVAKVGQNDSVIPANVGQAINFYQPDGIMHGRPQIRAADPLPGQKSWETSATTTGRIPSVARDIRGSTESW